MDDAWETGLVASDEKLKLDRFATKMINVFDKRIHEVVLLKHNYASILLNTGTRSGRIYKKTRLGKTHQASAPGEPPKSDLGRLVGSLNTRVTRDANAINGDLTVGTDYAQGLEYGTSRMAARPFMRPTLAALKQKILKKMAGK